MRKTFVVAGLTVVTLALLMWSREAFGARSVWFALVVVWLPMTWLGVVSRFVRPRLPERYHALHRWERDGRLYELLGVRLVKRLLRRGPLAVFNPDLHLPADPTAPNVAHLDQRMRDAEASHFILLVLMLGVVVHATAHAWWAAAGWTLLFDVVVNGYPVMLQRYNRALLDSRFGPSRERQDIRHRTVATPSRVALSGPHGNADHHHPVRAHHALESATIVEPILELGDTATMNGDVVGDVGVGQCPVADAGQPDRLVDHLEA